MTATPGQVLGTLLLTLLLRLTGCSQTGHIVSPQGCTHHGASLRLLLWDAAGSQRTVTAISFQYGQPFISLAGPTHRTTPGNPVPFNCTTDSFGSSDFSVTWIKDRDEHPASAQHLVTGDKGNYSVTSKVWIHGPAKMSCRR
ncbi:hypothetical protein J1605_001178 [Eschrichtius robustus]|uniref:Ig-like domain-containing protein n=1 Tax=Eschrichtius robustus TaxID=9764 RepID=A0AB34GGS7_ESCRO|nr:hypothetical protein J1605_001178 [Eschrichtius robustus]